ncbi:DUF1830 domain-containing protein [Phormidium yuhuli AB48]|uniref:DUF1830 domain-containing protein n=1 Tax=Phormidium yuhuli AB48 TaxID=2940671 RepID=A0ABY5ALU0_9CYAN|nr:DUF1830 domain-containing protein [Phormidium yuhuli]USR90177.1 DUF1830 domain-containing protein [Phormidium yuhuli AB48]
MAQILDPLPKDSSDPILCCYINATSQIQVARITNIQNWYFERVVFPGQRLVFEAMPQAQLEIHTGMMASAILSDTISCQRLKVTTEAEAEPEPEQQVSGDSDSTVKGDRQNVKNHEPLPRPSPRPVAEAHKAPALASVD